MRVVLDVNVLVSGFPASRRVPSRILDAWADGVFDLVVSEHILDGAKRAWSNVYYRNRYGQGEVELALGILRAQGILVEPVANVHGVARDLEDDLVLATAISGRATCLVTGDRRFRQVDEYRGVRILTPREFLSIIEPPA